MAKCVLCDNEMTDQTVLTCVGGVVVIPKAGVRLKRVIYPFTETKPCSDCGVAPGGFHHSQCDMEECPRCNGQMISCACGVKAILADGGTDAEAETVEPLDEDERDEIGEIAEIIQQQKDRLFVGASLELLPKIEGLMFHFDQIIQELESLAEEETD